MRQQGAQHGQRVADIEVAHQLRLDQRHAQRAFQVEVGAGVTAAELAGAQHQHAGQVGQAGRILQGVADDGIVACQLAFHVARQAQAHGVVQVDDGRFQAGPVEQLDLGGLVGGHVAVVIEMVARQIGKHGDVEMHAGRAFLVQADRRHFDGDGLRAGVAHGGQFARQQHGVRRGIAGDVECDLAARLAQAHAQGPDDGRRFTEARQRLRQPQRARGLAIRARHAGAEHGAVGHAVERMGDGTGQAFQVADGQLRHAPGGVPVGVVMHDGRCALRDGGGDELRGARIGEKHVAALHAARIGRQLPGRGSRFDPQTDVLYGHE